MTRRARSVYLSNIKLFRLSLASRDYRLCLILAEALTCHNSYSRPYHLADRLILSAFVHIREAVRPRLCITLCPSERTPVQLPDFIALNGEFFVMRHDYGCQSLLAVQLADHV